MTTQSIRAVLFMLLMPLGAHAGWEILGTSDADNIYLDPSSVRRSGQKARVLMLRDAAVERRTAQGQPFYSRKLYFEFDCATSQYRVLSTVVLAGHMGGGEVMESFGEPDALQATPPDTIAAGLQAVVCR